MQKKINFRSKAVDCCGWLLTDRYNYHKMFVNAKRSTLVICREISAFSYYVLTKSPFTAGRPAVDSRPIHTADGRRRDPTVELRLVGGVNRIRN